MHPTQLGGTRHLSAAQFVHDQRDAVALVASQDGRFTVFAWSPCEDMVHAHRVETLLLVAEQAAYIGADARFVPRPPSAPAAAASAAIVRLALRCR